jgi:integrase
MLPQEVLSLLRQWWKVRPTRYDADVPVSERWLFPGHRPARVARRRALADHTLKTKLAAMLE